jgi:hypothetical protein
VYYADPTDGPIDWIAITWYIFTVGPCPFGGYIIKNDRIRSRQLRVTSISSGRSTQTRGEQ